MLIRMATATAMVIRLMAIIGPTATTVLTPITADLMATTVGLTPIMVVQG